MRGPALDFIEITLDISRWRLGDGAIVYGIYTHVHVEHRVWACVPGDRLARADRPGVRRAKNLDQLIAIGEVSSKTLF